LIALAVFFILPIVSPLNLNATHAASLLRCLYGFSLGIVGWKVMPWVGKWSLGGRLADSLIELAIVVAVAMLLPAVGVSRLSMVTPLVFFVAVMIFARERGVLSALLRTPPFVLIGTLSYSIYMIHWFLLWRYLNATQMLDRHGVFSPLVRLFMAITGDREETALLMGDLFTLGFLVLVMFCGYLSYRFVELPGQRFARSRVPGRALPAPRVVPGAP
jgi:peptidoglycan/LPS O-acetylase OafA/YrhL